MNSGTQAPQPPQMNEYQRRSLEILETNLKLLERIAIAVEKANTIPRNVAAAPTPAQSTTNDGDGPGGVASDYELLGQYGDPDIRKDPPRWKGSSYVGCRMSKCPAEYLEALAGFFDWMGNQRRTSTKVNDKGIKESDTAKYAFKDARRARGWAKRAGQPMPASASVADAFSESAFTSDDEIPFAVPLDVGPSHVRRRSTWERW